MRNRAECAFFIIVHFNDKTRLLIRPPFANSGHMPNCHKGFLIIRPLCVGPNNFDNGKILNRRKYFFF
ncbi:hypothetical protein C5689_17760 [Methylosinus sporium]|uniref:Uncharacterized protein n=1 Tax=Methylosinus sporium TaxID=428 RepID=A0A2U1SLP7_METSR|nr:hypothetical protein C5689_17760 [Methylosinus sporium]